MMVQVWAGVGALVDINYFAKSMRDCRGRKMGYYTKGLNKIRWYTGVY